MIFCLFKIFRCFKNRCREHLTWFNLSLYFPLFLQSMKLTSFDAQIPESLDMKEQKSATNITYLRVSAKEEKNCFQKTIWLATFISLLGIFGQFSDQKKTSTIAAGIRILTKTCHVFWHRSHNHYSIALNKNLQQRQSVLIRNVDRCRQLRRKRRQVRRGAPPTQMDIPGKSPPQLVTIFSL